MSLAPPLQRSDRGKTPPIAGTSVLVAALTLVVFLTFVPLSTNDYWLQVAIGKIIVETGEIPRTALFPFTEAQDYPFFAHEWLPSVFFHALNEGLGYEALRWIKGGLGLLLFGLAALLAFRVQGRWIPAVVLATVTVCATNQRHFLRPEIFAYVFLLGELLLLEEYRRTRSLRWLVGLPFLAVLWANCHGSFVLGPLLPLAFAAGDGLNGLMKRLEKPIRQMAPFVLVALLMALGVLVNPYGTELLHFATGFSGSNVIGVFYEWLPTFSDQFMASLPFKIFMAYFALWLVCVATGWRRLEPTDWLLILAFTYLAVSRQRHLALFVYISLPILARALKGRFESPRATTSLTLSAVPILLLLVALVFRYGNAYGAKWDEVASWRLSPRLVEEVRTRQIEGNVFNSVALGAEIAQKFHPQLRITVDSRIDVYAEDYWQRYFEMLRDETRLLRFIEEYDVRYLFLTIVDFETSITRMGGLHRQGWRKVYEDGLIVVLTRMDVEGLGGEGTSG